MIAIPVSGSAESLDLQACAFVSDAEIDQCFSDAYLVYLQEQRYDAIRQAQLCWRRLNAITGVSRIPGWSTSLVDVEAFVRSELRYYIARVKACGRRTYA